jgi:REP element-mobilizing transposase RayT
VNTQNDALKDVNSLMVIWRRICSYQSNEIPAPSSCRLHGHDYCSNGYYFVTICTDGNIHLFGHLKDNRVLLNEYGLIAHREWIKTAQILYSVKLDTFIIMPDHVRGILKIENNSYSHMLRATRRIALLYF